MQVGVRFRVRVRVKVRDRDRVRVRVRVGDSSCNKDHTLSVVLVGVYHTAFQEVL